MKVLILPTLAICLTFASADPSLGACGPTPPTVAEFDPERVSGTIGNIIMCNLSRFEKLN